MLVSCLKKILLIYIGTILIELTKGSGRHRDWDICSHWNGRRHFLELGERGELHAFNVSTSNYRSILYTPINNFTKIEEPWYQCNLELVTCAECVIRITFTHTNFSKKCIQPISSDDGNPTSNRCPCEHIMFSEPPYESTISGQDFCGDGKVFRSKTRSLLLKFFFRATYSHIFSLQYFSERNVQITSGSPRQTIVSNYSQIVPQIISTPYFPMPYPRDYGVEHILTCESEDCIVRLEFTDFQLGLRSTMEIFDSNGQTLDTYNGEHFRPPIVFSTGKSLLLQFRGNGVNGIGYKAEITFVAANQIKQIVQTDCGGMIEGLGGAITMMDMVENQTDSRAYDCIWIIKPGNNYMMMKTHVSIRVDAFAGFDSKSDLIINQGISSDGVEMETVHWSNKGLSHINHIAPVVNGFYIRLKGTFKKNTRLAIVYSVFNFMNCYIGSEFLCENNHCISMRLHCDGFDHCGDGSDEVEALCEQEWTHKNDRNWYSHKPNYYFPKIDQYPDLKTATGIFVISTFGVLVVLTGWMIILYRMGVRARNQRELQNHLHTISELLDGQDESHSLHEDHPPDYEAPPDYEQVIKVGMVSEINASNRQRTRKLRRNKRKSSKNLSNQSQSNDIPHNSIEHLPHTSNNESRVPVFGTETQNIQPANNIEEIVNKVINGTTACETTKTTASTTNSTEREIRQNGSISSESSVTLLESNQPNSSCSIGTSTQFEEYSAGFKDDIDVSLSLAIPHTSISEPKTNQNLLYNINNQTKKAWVIFNTGHVHTIAFKRQRLRPSYSSPETFSNNYLVANEIKFDNNNKSERNSFMSNTTMFGSDLSTDLISCSEIDTKQTELSSLTLSSGYNPVHKSNIKNKYFYDTNNSSEINDDESKLKLINYDSDCDPSASCVSSVNLISNINSSKKQLNYYGKKKRNGRSKSFTQNDRQQIISKFSSTSSVNFKLNLRKCSSMELLIGSTHTPGYYV